MAPVIQGGNIIKGGKVAEGTIKRPHPNAGAPVAGTTLAGIIAVGEFVQDTATGNLYEYTEPAGTPTYTRRDTV